MKEKKTLFEEVIQKCAEHTTDELLERTPLFDTLGDGSLKDYFFARWVLIAHFLKGAKFARQMYLFHEPEIKKRQADMERKTIMTTILSIAAIIIGIGTLIFSVLCG